MAEHKACCAPRRADEDTYGKGSEKETTSAKHPLSFKGNPVHNIIAIPGGVGHVGTDKPILALQYLARTFSGNRLKCRWVFWNGPCKVF